MTTQTEILSRTVTDLVDELHTLGALISSAKRAANDYATGERDAALVDLIDRLMLAAEDRVGAALRRADDAHTKAAAAAA